MQKKNEFYPIIKIPNELYKALESLPILPYKPEPPKKETLLDLVKPTEPNKPSSIFVNLLTSVVSALLGIGIITLLKNSKNYNDGAMLGFFGLLFIIGGAIMFFKSFFDNSDEHEYQKELKKYNTDLQEYNQKKANELYYNEQLENEYQSNYLEYLYELDDWQKQADKILSHSNIINHRYQLISSILKTKIHTPQIIPDILKKGVSETKFFETVKRIFFRFDCFQDATLVTSQYDFNHYKPDIIISYPDKNFVVAIEIDEPYVGFSGEPIHYIGSSDNLRDDFF